MNKQAACHTLLLFNIRKLENKRGGFFAFSQYDSHIDSLEKHYRKLEKHKIKHSSKRLKATHNTWRVGS